MFVIFKNYTSLILIVSSLVFVLKIYLFSKISFSPSMVAYAFKLSTLEEEAGKSL